MSSTDKLMHNKHTMEYIFHEKRLLVILIATLT